MAKVQSDVDLFPFNTFGVHAMAKSFIEINETTDIASIPKEKTLILGAGANVLFTKDFDGTIVKNNLRGKKFFDGLFEVASGEDWIELVNYLTTNGWSGIEKMAYIPGTIGGAVVGNIGAYGQTFEDIFVSARASGQVFSKNECKFCYRGSVFKDELKNLFVESVMLRLSKDPKSEKIAAETTALRKSKLPDWKILGTAGSFFKNPFVSQEKLKILLKDFPDLPNFFTPRSLGEVGPNQYKIPAGFLLEKLGWKGKRIGNVGTYEKHALVVVNYGGATGREILDFTNQMQTSVKKAFDIDLEPEVRVI